MIFEVDTEMRIGPDPENRRVRLLSEGSPLDAGACEDERAREGVHSVAVKLELSPALLDEVELLLRVLVSGLIVFVEDPAADVRPVQTLTPNAVIPK